VRCHPRIRRSPAEGAFFAAALLLALSGAARADDFYVNTADDLPDASLLNPTADVDINTQGEQTSLRAAVMQANHNSGPDTIIVPDGLWKLTLKDPKDALLDTAATGDLDVTDDLMIIGTPADPESGADGTVIDGKKLKHRLFEVAPGNTLTLRDLTLRGGKAPKTQSGGAALVAGSLVLDHVIVRNCKAAEDGGAIDLTTSASALLLTDVLFYKNIAGADGGAIDADSGITQGTRVTFHKNRAGGEGGALELSSAMASLTNATLAANKAKSDGGAVSLEVGSVLTLVGVTSSGNSCKKTSGFSLVDTGVEPDQLGNSLLARNVIFDDKGKRNASGGISSLGGNVDSGTSCDLPADEWSDTDPQVLQLANYGGFTPTFALDDASPAIDGGKDNGAPETDQRGMPRKEVGGKGHPLVTCDAGAFEFQPTPEP
jgi:hypothetical protein